MLLSTTAARALFKAGSKTALKAVAARGACSVAIGKKKVPRYIFVASASVVSSRAVAADRMAVAKGVLLLLLQEGVRGRRDSLCCRSKLTHTVLSVIVP